MSVEESEDMKDSLRPPNSEIQLEDKLDQHPLYNLQYAQARS